MTQGNFQDPPPPRESAQAMAGTAIQGMIAGKVKAPAIGLMVTAILGILLQLFSVIWNIYLMVAGMGAVYPEGVDLPEFAMASPALSIVFAFIGLIVGAVILFGAMKMKALQSHGFALTASILAMIPCISPCCLLGPPIGIWALVVLLNNEVKAAFS